MTSLIFEKLQFRKKKIIKTNTFSTIIIVKNEKIIVSVVNKTIDMKIKNNIKKHMQTKSVFMKKKFQNHMKTLISMKNLMTKNFQNFIHTIFIRNHRTFVKNVINPKKKNFSTTFFISIFVIV